ncbi:MAG: YwiC-like family protein [Chloroflexota bacterium]
MSLEHAPSQQTYTSVPHPRRLLVPREHGAWAMWLVPGVVGAALAGGGYGLSALLVAAAFCIFWARYPLWLWARSRERAFPTGAVPSTLAAGLIGAALGLALMVAYGRWLLLAFGAAGALVMGAHLLLTSRGRGRSLAAEFLGIAGLCLTGPAAYYAATGALDAKALVAWLFPALFFGVSVFYVKLRVDGYARIKAKKPLTPLGESLAGYVALALAVVGALAALGVASPWALLAYAPVVGQVAWPIRGLDTPPKLKRLGVMWAIHSTLFAVLLIVLA